MRKRAPRHRLPLRYNSDMKTEKQQALELIDSMPDQVSAETIITELQFRLTVLRRGEDAGRGHQLMTHDEAKSRLSGWLKSTGT